MSLKFIDNTFPKFMLVGIINTVVGTSVMFILYNFANCSYWISSISNYLIGGLVSYLLNKNYTFKSNKKGIGQITKFSLVLALSYLIAYGIAKEISEIALKGFDLSVRDNIAMCLGVCGYSMLNYIGQRYYVFSSD